MSEEEKEKTKFIVFENQTFALYNLRRLETKEEQDLEAEEGVKYTLILHISINPYQLAFSYATIELREKKINWLKKQMEDTGIEFVQETN